MLPVHASSSCTPRSTVRTIQPYTVKPDQANGGNLYTPRKAIPSPVTGTAMRYSISRPTSGTPRVIPPSTVPVVPAVGEPHAAPLANSPWPAMAHTRQPQAQRAFTPPAGSHTPARAFARVNQATRDAVSASPYKVRDARAQALTPHMPMRTAAECTVFHTAAASSPRRWGCITTPPSPPLHPCTPQVSWRTKHAGQDVAGVITTPPLPAQRSRIVHPIQRHSMLQPHIAVKCEVITATNHHTAAISPGISAMEHSARQESGPCVELSPMERSPVQHVIRDTLTNSPDTAPSTRSAQSTADTSMHTQCTQERWPDLPMNQHELEHKDSDMLLLSQDTMDGIAEPASCVSGSTGPGGNSSENGMLNGTDNVADKRVDQVTESMLEATEAANTAVVGVINQHQRKRSADLTHLRWELAEARARCARLELMARTAEDEHGKMPSCLDELNACPDEWQDSTASTLPSKREVEVKLLAKQPPPHFDDQDLDQRIAYSAIVSLINHKARSFAPYFAELLEAPNVSVRGFIDVSQRLQKVKRLAVSITKLQGCACGRVDLSAFEWVNDLHGEETAFTTLKFLLPEMDDLVREFSDHERDDEATS